MNDGWGSIGHVRVQRDSDNFLEEFGLILLGLSSSLTRKGSEDESDRPWIPHRAAVRPRQIFTKHPISIIHHNYPIIYPQPRTVHILPHTTITSLSSKACTAQSLLRNPNNTSNHLTHVAHLLHTTHSFLRERSGGEYIYILGR